MATHLPRGRSWNRWSVSAPGLAAAPTLPSRVRHLDSGVSPALGPNAPSTQAGTMGSSLDTVNEVFDMFDTDVFGSGGADVHENEPSSINDGGLTLAAPAGRVWRHAAERGGGGGGGAATGARADR